MRVTRLFRTSLALAALGAVSAADAGAQKRTFEDSWFWGVKGGGMMYSSRRVNNAVAPGVGAEWLITRTRAALNVSASQYFFDDLSAIDDPSNPAVGRTVSMENMRSIGASILVFPKTFGAIRPYGGLGINFALISEVTAQGAFTSAQQRDTVRATLQEARTGTLPLLTLGAMTSMRGINFFAQGGFSPSKQTFLFNRNSTYFFEGGVRYNIGSAIERPN
jgi:hypothetical protein